MKGTGLEITSENLKAVVVENTGKIKVVSFAEVALPAGTVENGILKNSAQFKLALKQLFKKIGFHRYLIVSLPPEQIFCKTQKLPILEEEALRELIQTNVSQFLPYPPTEAYFDWQILPSPSFGNQQEVVFVSIHKSVADSWINVLLDLHIVPLAFESFPFSLGRLLPANYSDPILIVRKNEATLEGVVYKTGPQIAKSFSNLKTSQEAIRSANSLADFYETEKKEEVKSFYPIGLPEAVANPLSRRFSIFHLEGELVSKVKPEFLPALSSALRGLIDPKEDRNLSLLPLGSRQSYELKKVSNFCRTIISLAFAFGLLSILLLAASWLYLNNLIKEADTTLVQLNQKPSTILPLGELEGKAKLFNQVVSLWQKINQETLPAGEVMGKIINSLPEGINITRIDWPAFKEPLTISGFADKREAITTFKENLTGQNWWQKVELPPSSLGLAENIIFSIKLYK